MQNCRILIFGGTGSLGKTLIKRYADKNLIQVFSRDESKHWTIKNEFRHSNLSFFVGDIRDYSRCADSIISFNPTHIILASALKHVDVCENSPSESVKTNIIGIENVVNIVRHNYKKISNLKTVLMVSTDKACYPINVYGMCKSIAERIVTSACTFQIPIKFVAVRYGNVLESRGSIIPLFKYQSENLDKITVTDPRMTRYVMTLEESVDLIDAAIKNADSGQTWVPDLPSMKVMDLAEIFSDLYSKPIEIIGMRPGEKLHEDLINISESMRTKKFGKYYSISSSFTPPFQDEDFSMRSDKLLMDKSCLKKRLQTLGILEKSFDQFPGKTIEEVRK